MTLILTVNGPETIWMLSDRRLSIAGKTVKDDARKLLFLETTDGVAILGYAGLGATARGTEPTDWMSRVLRGRGLPLEQSLSVLAEAMKRELPPHLAALRLPGVSAHHLIAAAFVGREPRAYSIDIALPSGSARWMYRHTRWVTPATAPPPRPPRMMLGGSGVPFLLSQRGWRRDILRLVKAHDQGKVSPLAVADRLAALNLRVHHGTADHSVGPRSIVAWRYRKEGPRRGGGAHKGYTGEVRDQELPVVPTIARGRDMLALVNALLPHFLESYRKRRGGDPHAGLDTDAMNASLASLPEDPDESLS